MRRCVGEVTGIPRCASSPSQVCVHIYNKQITEGPALTYFVEVPLLPSINGEKQNDTLPCDLFT